jgi:hypothetical protein
VQPLLALGFWLAVRPWALRIVLATLVFAGAAVQLSATHPNAAGTLADVRTVLTQAGYRVDGSRQSWLDGRIRGRSWLIARHPACRQTIVVKLVELDAPPPVGGAVPQFFVYDAYESGFPSRLTILGIALKLELRTILSFGRLPRPPRAMLAITDPSACLSLASPDWRLIWRGVPGVSAAITLKVDDDR